VGNTLSATPMVAFSTGGLRPVLFSCRAQLRKRNASDRCLISKQQPLLLKPLESPQAPCNRFLLSMVTMQKRVTNWNWHFGA